MQVFWELNSFYNGLEQIHLSSAPGFLFQGVAPRLPSGRPSRPEIHTVADSGLPGPDQSETRPPRRILHNAAENQAQSKRTLSKKIPNPGRCQDRHQAAGSVTGEEPARLRLSKAVAKAPAPAALRGREPRQRANRDQTGQAKYGDHFFAPGVFEQNAPEQNSQGANAFSL